jgi:hypothetical protein
MRPLALSLVLAAGLAPLAYGQTTSPGPTNPSPQPNPSAKPNSDLVINPTVEECEKGWHSEPRWTKEQFENFCGKMKASK